MPRRSRVLSSAAALLLAGVFARAQPPAVGGVDDDAAFANSAAQLGASVNAAAASVAPDKALETPSLPADAAGESQACGVVPPPKMGAPQPPAASPSPWADPAVAQWSRDVRGARSGILNLYVHGRLDDIAAALVAAGWEPSRPNNAKDDLKYVGAATGYGVTVAIHHIDPRAQPKGGLLETIEEMPVSNEYVDGRLEIAAFEKNNRILGGRDHLRVFDLNAVDAAGLPVWGIAANRDVGLKLDLRRPNQAFLNHRIDPDTDPERDLVAGTLLARPGSTISAITVAFPCPPPPDHAYSADGRALLVTLVPPRVGL